MSRVLVVLPTFNERDSLAQVVAGVRTLDYEVLVVDDRSPDGTGEIAAELAAQDPGVAVMHRPRKLGLGSAYLAGFKLGLERGYDFLVEMDSDGSHRIEHLDAIVAASARVGGLAIGSRYIPGGGVSGWPWHRSLLSAGANAYCRLLLGWSVRDATSGYRCYSSAALVAVGLDRVRSSGYEFQVEMVYRCLEQGVAVCEIPIRFEDRTSGRSKVSRSEVMKGLAGVLRLAAQRWR
ncbi:MAG TPA: polyprenol monophosphomannose synthase [Candidatus Nitrosotalea sp.]|nr:polyprenol monophosphomannose synthase [Candidatus Nitrosotalea sp.]